MELEFSPGKIVSITDAKENRRANELEYVLFHQRRARQEVVKRPRLFGPDALEKIDQTIALIEQSMPANARICITLSGCS
jgi:hypothetical protein